MAATTCTDANNLNVVFFSVGRRGKQETAVFNTDSPSEEVKDLFRSAAEAGPRDILKLWDCNGRLLNISPSLEPNCPETRYTLEVVAAHCNGMLFEELGVDLRALEDRVCQLERRLRGEVEELPPNVQELKRQVDKFRTKLETTEHLSWLGFHNNFPSSLPLSTSVSSRRLQYRRKSSTEKRRVRDKFFSICDVAVSEEVRLGLRRPSFDSCQWEDEEILALLQQMYIDLELPSRFNIDMSVLRNFLTEVYDHYNDVPFHNFRHCFCVSQMMYAMIWCVDLPSKIGDLETLILLTSCICHDLDHPGYNNIYQINAGTELALRYNDISPLENHHCSVAFQLLSKPECNFLRCLNYQDFRSVREGMIRCILATDMARHNEILEQFREVTPEFDFRNKAHINLLAMVLIKVADISNEARPMDVAEPWLDRLLQEFFKQSDAEKLEGLPVTPFMDRDKITKPSSQVGFIGLVLLPLFEALGELFTDLQELIVIPVREALEYYRRLNDAERLHRKSVVDCSSSSDHSAHLVKSLSIQSKRSNMDDEEEDFPLNCSDDEEDTVTEVEHSEKALKFKISTEGGRRSYPGSRKGSRDNKDLEFSKTMHSRLTSPTALSSEEDDLPPKDLPEDLKVLKDVLEETILELSGESKENKKNSAETHRLEKLKEDVKTIQHLQKSISDIQKSPKMSPKFRGNVEFADQARGNHDEPHAPAMLEKRDTLQCEGLINNTDSDNTVLNLNQENRGDLKCSENEVTVGEIGPPTTVLFQNEMCVDNRQLAQTESNKNEDLKMCGVNTEKVSNACVENQPRSSSNNPDRNNSKPDHHNQKSITLLYRLRHFADRLSFNQSVDKELPLSKQQTSTSENSTPKRNKCDANFENRATTLPKLRRRKGWRSFIGGSKGHVPASSIESSEKDLSTFEKKNEDSRKSSSDSHDGKMLSPQGASSSILAGSLDSVLNQGGKENNNRKKSESPGFLNRQHWMASLAASFRSRRTQQDSTEEWRK